MCKDNAEALLCLAEHASSVPLCAACHLQYDVMSDISSCLEICDPLLTLCFVLFFNHVCVYVCVSASVCHLDVCVPCFCSVRRLSACMRLCAGRTQREGFLLVLRPAVGTERKIGKMIRPPHPHPPTQNTQVSTTWSETWNP